MAATAMRDSPDIANGSHRPRSGGAGMMDYENEPTPETAEQSYKPSKSKSKGKSRQGPPGRSFSVRARDANLSNALEEPSPNTPSSYIDESYTPRGMPLNSHPPDPQPHTQENEDPELLEETPSIPKVSSPPSRSNTMRSTSSSQRRDWASDRSPLQKLEVTLNGISKEEKRARVQEAEMKLREKLARQKVEREQAEAAAAAAAAATAASRPDSQQKSYSEDRRQSDTAPRGAPRNAQSNPRQATGAPAQHRRNQSMNPQYPVVQRPEDAQYARAEIPLPSNARMGSVHRKQVSVSGPVARPGPAAENMKHTRSVSQQGPYPSRQAAPAATAAAAAAVVSSEDRLDTPPAVRAQTSVESHSRPKKQSVSFNVPPPTPPPIFEWKNAEPARLTAAEFDFQNLDIDRGKTWWEGGGTKDRRKSRALPKNYQTPAQKLTGVNHHKIFQPRLFLRCGPLLRYTGLKKTTVDGIHGVVEKETWRGSVLIVTKDSRSDYSTPPTLRLFAQPMDLLPPPPAEISREDGVQLAPEYIDPTANLMKVGRDGRPLYVKRVDKTDEELDLSAVENDDGLYGMRPSSPDDKSEQAAQPIPANRIHAIDGETASLHREIAGVRLYADAARDVTFWRFNLEVDLGTSEQRIAYRINEGPALGFWVPATGQPMNIAFHSGNGFSPSVDTNRFCGPDPLWRDILNEHQTKPFHVMIGGGDQIFNDSVTTESQYFQEWMKIKNPAERYSMPFTPEFRAELEHFYLHRYASWFSQGLFSLANSQIPMVNMWNDHEIFEGYGSYNVDFMSSMVISGLGRIAHKFYLLFQHHCVVDETEADEPSWLLGYQPGPYIPQKSRNIFMSLGSDVMLLGLDCRTERTSNEVISEKTYDLIWDRCYNELNKGETKHLIVLCSVPVAYPRVAMLKNIMNSRKSLGKAGMFGGLVNRSGGSVEVYDDHWAGKHLKAERTWLIEDLQDIAAEKSVRITILSGDVHLAAIGQFYSNPKLDVAKDKDYRYIPNVISSAIADMPETDLISDMLNRRNTVHHLDSNTDEDVIPIFSEDVDGKSRNNKRLLPRRNWCSIREYRPGLTPPGTPDSETPIAQEQRPRKLQRTLSLGRNDRGPGDEPGTAPAKSGGLFRRLSGRRPPPTRAMSFGREGEAPARRASVDITSISRPLESGNSYFPGDTNQPQPGQFHRRPTNLSVKAKKAAKHGDDGVGAFVDLQGGLAITINMEVSPQDPAGITVPYKLLVPALRYERDPNEPRPTQVVKGWRKWLNMPRRKKNDDPEDDEDEDEEDVDDYEDDDTANNTRANAAATAASPPQHPHQHYDEYPSDEESEVHQRLPPSELTGSELEDDDEYDDEPVPKRKGKKWFGMQ